MKASRTLKLIVALMLMVFIVSLCGCIIYNYVPNRVLKQYDLNDEKIPAKVSDNDFSDDMVIVILKRSPTKYKPTVLDFAFYNIENIEYLFENSERCFLFVYLKYKGKDKVLEAVKYFDSLSIVYSVSPDEYLSFA